MDKFETAKQFFFEGLRLLEVNNYQGAERQFSRSLDLVPDRVSTLNNLSTVKLRLNKFTEAEELALKAAGLAETSPEAWSSLGIALAAMGRPEESLQACDRALQCNRAHSLAWLTKSTTLLDLRRFDEALAACEQALKLEPDKYEFLHAKSLILKELLRVEEAKGIYQRALDLRLAKSPVFVGERRATQKAEILVLNRNPEFDDSLNSFERMLRFCENFPGQLANHIQDDFHFTYVFKAGAEMPNARKHISQPDLVINNYVNGELILSRGILPALSELVDGFAAPVVNHPTKAVQTTRDVSAKLLEDLPSVLVPKTIRFSSAGKSREVMVREIEGHFDYPLITRSLTMQRGQGMTKVDSRDALTAVLAGDFPETFFVTQFVDSRGGAQFFRKIRAAVVGNEIVLVRVDYNADWNVHGPRRTDAAVAYCLANGHLFEEEKRICKDPEACLGRPAVQSLQAVRKRIPMDVFGIDFDVSADGVLVFYEANATMNLFCTRRKEVPYAKEAQDYLKEAFRLYFTSLVGRQ